MDLAVAEQVAAYIRGAAESRAFPVSVNFYGGEPFLNFEAMQAVRGGVSAPAIWGVFSNGASATEEQVRWCRDRSVQPHRSTAGCPGAAALTRPGDYTVRWLEEGRLWQDYASRHRLTVTPETARYVVRSVHWLHEHGYYGPVDLATDDYAAWSPEALGKYGQQLEVLVSEFVDEWERGHRLGIENFTNFGRVIFGQSKVTVFGCGAGWSTWGITWSGAVVPCHRFFRSGLRPGQQASTILHPEFDKELVDTVAAWASGRTREECSNCEARQCCSRGCPHVARMTLGVTDGSPPHRCHITRLYASAARWINDRLPDDWWRAQATPCTFTEMS